MEMDPLEEENAEEVLSESEEVEVRGSNEEEEETGTEVEQDEEGEEEDTAAEGEEGVPGQPIKKTRAQLLEEEEEPPPPKAGIFKRDNVLDFANVKALTNFLSMIKLSWPEDKYKYNEKVYNAQAQFKGYPRTYFHNTAKEKAVSWHADNFRQQFLFLHPDRRPLFLAPENECGFQKLFPTFLKPRLMPFPDLFYAESCVEYFKDFFNNDFFQPCTDPPRQVRSPFSLLKERRANCYEHSLVIATCLLGAGYRAYVVDGYATKEVTTLSTLTNFTDQFTDEEDHFKEEVQVNTEERPVFLMSDLEDESKLREEEIIRPVSPSKYKVQAKKHYISGYQEMMKGREEAKRREAEEKQQEADLEYALEHPVQQEVDPLLGFRIHAWVVILPGTRDVTEPFFLEPFTGTRREMTDDAFLGIEAVFNHKNYWVNLQDCATGVGDLNYDLENNECWASLLKEPEIAKKKAPDGPIQFSLDEDEDAEIQIPEMYLDMPVSWTAEMFITPKEYKMRFPGGAKIFEYNDAMVERAAPYSQPDGMVQKVLQFNDDSRKASNLRLMDERFDKRVDLLIRRKFKPDGRIIHEFFGKGRPDSLKEHIYIAGRNKPHYLRQLYYYSGWHPDKVAQRQVLPNRLVETFENRKDCLTYRETFFGGVLCRTLKEKLPMAEELAFKEQGQYTRPRRIILGIIEKFSRNPSKPASEDIAEKHRLIEDGRILLTFHYGEENYIRDTLEFYKPEQPEDKDEVTYDPEYSHEFHADPLEPPLNNYRKSVFLDQLLAEEKKIREQVERSEEEIYQTVTGRVMENWFHKLDNTVIGESEDEDEEEEVVLPPGETEETTKFSKVEHDFAAPYLLHGLPEDKEEEIELKKRIMQDAKDRITRKAEQISICYHEESKHLVELVVANDCTKVEKRAADQGGYSTCYQRILQRLHVMERKMVRYQSKAPRAYCRLLLKVLEHPKLNKFATQEKIDDADEVVRLENVKLLEFAYKLRASDRGSCCQLDYVFDFSRGAYDNDEGDAELYEEIQQARKTKMTMKEEEARMSMSPSVVARTSVAKASVAGIERRRMSKMSPVVAGTSGVAKASVAGIKPGQMSKLSKTKK